MKRILKSVVKNLNVLALVTLPIAAVGCTCSNPVEMFSGQVTSAKEMLTTQLTSLNTRVDEIGIKIEGLDSTNPLKANLQSGFATLKSSLTNLQSLSTDALNSLTSAFESKDLAKLKDALTSKFEPFKSSLAELTGKAQDLETQFADASKAPPAPTAAPGPKKGDVVDFTDIDFVAGTEKLDTNPRSTETLTKLVTLAKSCSAIRLKLTGHTSKEGSDKINVPLSLKRAKSVQKYLADNGVKPEVVESTDGKGSAESAVTEPAPNSPEAKKMSKEELEAVRVKNRRISVSISQGCN